MALFKHTIIKGISITHEIKDNVTGEEGTNPVLFKRYAIEKARGDIYDIASDGLKWNGLVTSLVAILYDVMPDENKDSIPADKRALIENTLNLYRSARTTTDVKLEEQGFDFITELIDREIATAKVLDKK